MMDAAYKECNTCLCYDMNHGCILDGVCRGSGEYVPKMDDVSYISLKMEHVNTDGTKGESVTAEITQEEYDKIIEYLMR